MMSQLSQVAHDDTQRSVTRHRCGNHDLEEWFKDVYGQDKEGSRMLLLFCFRYTP